MMSKLGFRFKISLALCGVICLISASALISCSQKENDEKPNDDYYVAAYIWPSCHHDERFGDMLWPESVGEWEIIKKGTPRFEGHYQPRMPLWEDEMDNDPKVVEKWIDIAVDHGINVFIYDWYWYDGGPFLESALNDGFLKAENNSKMSFYVMWGNHDVKRNYWNPHEFKDDTSVLWDGATDMKNFKIIVDRVINQYFKKSNYFKIDDKPVFSIFSIYNFIKSFGGLKETKDAIDYFNAETKKAGFPGLHIQLLAGGVPNENYLENINTLGASSITQYNWGADHIQKIIYNGAWNQLSEEINGMQYFLYPISQMHRLDGMIPQDSLKKGKKMLYIITNHQKVLLPFYKKQKIIAIPVPNNLS